MMSGLMKIPVELMLKVMEYLGVEAFYSLKATNKHLSDMLQNEVFAKTVLKVGLSNGTLQKYADQTHNSMV